MTEEIFYNEAGKPFIDKELKHPANWKFSYKNIMHVATPKEYDSQREFEDAIIEKYAKIQAGTYPRKHHADSFSDLNKRYFEMREGVEKLGQKMEEAKLAEGETALANLRAEVAELKEGKSEKAAGNGGNKKPGKPPKGPGNNNEVAE